MLKSTLEVLLKEAELKIAELRINSTKLTAQLHSSTKEIEGLTEQVKFTSNQMKLIDHSIYTMLNVKFPKNPPMDLSPDAVNVAWKPDTEEKTLLLFLRGLCTTGVHSASDLFNHMGRS